jgi:hypothetical protein
MNGIAEFNPVDQVRLVQEKIGAIKTLRGFQRHHYLPAFGGSSDLLFLAEITALELDEDLQAVFSSLRSAFGLKRRQMAVTGPEFRYGVIATPYFNYEITVEPVEKAPGNILWRRAITGIRDPNQVFSDMFFSVFGNRFNILEISTRDLFEIEAIVDQVEDAKANDVSVNYDKDLNGCEIKIDQFDTIVEITENRIRIISNRDVPPRELLEAFLKVQRDFVAKLNVQSNPFLGDCQRAT